MGVTASVCVQQILMVSLCKKYLPSPLPTHTEETLIFFVIIFHRPTLPQKGK